MEALSERVLERDDRGRFVFDTQRETMSSRGRVRFKLAKVRRSWQEYEILESGGQFKHVYEPPSGEREVLNTRFELETSPSNRIELTLGEFVRGWKVIKPVYRNMVAHAYEEKRDALFVCVTRVRFYPILTVGETLHLYPTESGLVPVSYAFNSLDYH